MNVRVAATAQKLRIFTARNKEAKIFLLGLRLFHTTLTDMINYEAKVKMSVIIISGHSLILSCINIVNLLT